MGLFVFVSDNKVQEFLDNCTNNVEDKYKEQTKNIYGKPKNISI